MGVGSADCGFAFDSASLIREHEVEGDVRAQLRGTASAHDVVQRNGVDSFPRLGRRFRRALRGGLMARTQKQIRRNAGLRNLARYRDESIDVAPGLTNRFDVQMNVDLSSVDGRERKFDSASSTFNEILGDESDKFRLEIRDLKEVCDRLIEGLLARKASERAPGGAGPLDDPSPTPNDYGIPAAQGLGSRFVGEFFGSGVCPQCEVFFQRFDPRCRNLAR